MSAIRNGVVIDLVLPVALSPSARARLLTISNSSAFAQKFAQNNRMASSRRATLTDVASAAAVSVTTASRAMRGQGDMSAATRARILAAAHRLGYSRSGERRGRPRSGTSLLFDLVLGHFHDPYSDEVTAGARIAAARLDYDLVLTAERDTPDDDWPMRIRSRGSAGVVLGLILPTSAQLAILQDADIPVVLLDPWAESSLALPSVRTTDRAGGIDAGEHLVAQGARRFVVIGGAPAYRYGRARVNGFESAVRHLMPDAHLVRVHADWTAASARRACAAALSELSSTDDGPIGLFACSDEMAAGAYRAAADAGLDIPNDMMVIGFDDVRGARWLQPSLTTVRQPIRQMAAAAIHALAQAAQRDPLAASVIELPTRLVVRGSTRAELSAQAPV
jgi:DNA-binding LacI/PurR family transcriptional regulator